MKLPLRLLGRLLLKLLPLRRARPRVCALGLTCTRFGTLCACRSIAASSCWLAPACLMDATMAPPPCFTAAPALRSRLPMRPLEAAAAAGMLWRMLVSMPWRMLRSATLASKGSLVA